MTNPDRAALEAAETARYAAMQAGDADALRAMSHPQMTYAHSSGVRDTLEEFLAKVGSGQVTYHSIEHPISDVIVSGDTAVVVGHMRASITTSGVDKTLNNGCISVWSRVGDRWQILAYQPTPVR